MIDYHLFGWLGLLLIHGSRLPQIFFMLKQKRASGLSLSGTAAVQAGLLAYLVYAVSQGDLVFIVSNAVGLVFQGVVLVLNFMWREPKTTIYDGDFYWRGGQLHRVRYTERFGVGGKPN